MRYLTNTELVMNKNDVFIDVFDTISMYMEANNYEFKFSKKNISMFIHIFKKVKDPRVKGRTTYKLENILTIIMYLVLIGRFRSFNYAAAYIDENKEEFKKLGLIEGNNVPSHDLFRYIFMILDANNLSDSIINKFKFITKQMLIKAGVDYDSKLKLYLGDGKEFNASGRSKESKNPLPNRNVFNIYDASLGIVRSSTVVDAKTNEIPEAQRMFNKFNLKNCVVTMDALHCQKDTTEVIIHSKGDYVLTVKDNQKLLVEEIDKRLERDKDKVINVSFNNIDYSILPLPTTYSGAEFEKLRAFIRITSHKRGKRSKDNILRFISSIDDVNINIATIDNRWQLENNPHRTKDEMFYEDQYRFTNKNAVKVMATFNNIAYSFFRLASAFMNTTSQRAKIRFEKDPVGIATSLIPMMETKNFEKELESHLKGRKKN